MKTIKESITLKEFKNIAGYYLLTTVYFNVRVTPLIFLEVLMSKYYDNIKN